MCIISLYDEKSLLIQAAEGDEMAFTQLFNSSHQELGDYMFALTKSMISAEEIVQDVFIKIWEKREQLAFVNNFRAYLFTVSRNYAFNALRQQARNAAKLEKWTHYQMQESSGTDDPDLEEYYVLIDEAISQLPPQQQKAWFLSRCEGLKHEEIASRLSLSRETVKRHISLASSSIKRYVHVHSHKFTTTLLFFYVLEQLSEQL
ncbi:MAG TPA: sigma-70 family RNA polymerase sigma factor [Sphingobacteriaceae bacterium]